MISELDKAIIREIQEDLPLVPEPYLVIAEHLGISENELLQKLRRMKELGVIRRFGAALRHREVGYVANAMVVWSVPKGKVHEVGEQMASFSEVSHCYERPTYPDWPYNMYTMVHAQSEYECEQIVLKIAQQTNIEKYQLLYSTKELKKSSMKYFVD